MSRSRISVMENPSYEKLTLTALKRIASAFDVALITRFVRFSDLVEWVSDLSPEKLEVPGFDNDSIAKSKMVATQTTALRVEPRQRVRTGISDDVYAGTAPSRRIQNSFGMPTPISQSSITQRAQTSDPLSHVPTFEAVVSAAQNKNPIEALA